MAVISVRLNKEEGKILQYLADYFHEDKSTLFKKSLIDLYEDIQDVKFIKKFIKENKKNKKDFVTADNLFC